MNYSTLTLDGKGLTSSSINAGCIPYDYSGGVCTESTCNTQSLLPGDWRTYISNVYIEHNVEGENEKALGDGYYNSVPTRGETIITIEGCLYAPDDCTSFDAMMKLQNAYSLKGNCQGYKLIEWTCGEDCTEDNIVAYNQASNSQLTITGSTTRAIKIKPTNYYTQSVVDIELSYDLGATFQFYGTFSGYPDICINLPQNSGVRLLFAENEQDVVSGDIFVYNNVCNFIKTYKAYGQVIQKPVFEEGEGRLIRNYEAKIRLRDYIYDNEPTVITGLDEQDTLGLLNNNTATDCCVSGGGSCDNNSCSTCCGGTDIYVDSCTDAEFGFCATIYWSGLELEDDVNSYPNGDPLGYIGKGIVFGNMDTGDYLRFKNDFELKRGDVLKICTNTEEVFLNGIKQNDILDEYSIYPTLTGGLNRLILKDLTSVSQYGILMKYDIQYNAIV